jgi:aspartate beta-hydroxylase
MFYRGAFLDPFFKQGAWCRTDFTHPHQQPQYFIPGIPSRRFYDAQQFEWRTRLEQNFAEIREELLGLLNVHGNEFGAFTTEFDNTVPGWNTFNFYVNGRRQDENCRRAPCTARIADELLEHEEGELTMFSALNPHSHIPPHVGPLNGILRCHLPLLAPDGCGLRVGGQTVVWETGKLLIFDDSFVHEVWNRSDKIRIVLFFNAWHPCLSLAERQALAELRRSYHNTPVGRHWTKQQETQRTSTMIAIH